MRFDEKIVIVTGGGGGIGLATAQLFASEGATVAINDLDPAIVDRAVATIEEHGGRAIALPGDVTDPAAVRTCVEKVLADLGRVDVLVNNAGITRMGPAEDYAHWRALMSTNLDSQFYWSQAVAKASMIPNRSGSIVNMASTAGLSAFPGDIGYIVSKHGVVGLTKALAVEWGQYNIRVNCVCPGLTQTEMVKAVEDAHPERFAVRRARIPLGRAATPEDQARSVVFLASDDASYATGLIMNVDGGQLALFSGFSLEKREA